MEGKFLDVMKISKPADFTYHLTFQDIQVIDMKYCTKFLNRAAATSDPIERLKLVATNWFSGIHLSMAEIGKMSPINPILGETTQREMPDGTKFYAE